MFQSAGIVYLVLILFGVILVECNARHGMDHGPWAKHKEKTIECYECNSEYDPRCGDPFDPYTIGKVNCSMKRPLHHITEKPTLCRKIVQKIQGSIRIVRGCGYIQDDRDDKECLMRSGTHDVNVKYCACTHNLCNTGNFRTNPASIVFLGIILLTTRLIQMA